MMRILNFNYFITPSFSLGVMELNDLLMPLVNKGQSINHIFTTHGDEIGLSEKTIYNYIDQHAFHVRNIDLPKKVRYRQRQNRPHEVLMKMDYKCRQGRTYTDFTSYMEQSPKLSIVEMDTVIGARGSGNVLLTMLFRNTNFMLIFLIPDKSQASVNAVFDKLTLLLGLDLFRKLFPVILTYYTEENTMPKFLLVDWYMNLFNNSSA